VLDVQDKQPDFDIAKLKYIDAVLDDRPCLPLDLLELLRELASYYLAPIGEVLQLALPALERERAKELKQQGLLAATTKTVGGRRIKIIQASPSVLADTKLKGRASQLLAHVRATGEVPLSQLTQIFPTAREITRKLQQEGLVDISEREVPNDPFFADPVVRDTPPVLVPAQVTAVEAIDRALRTLENHSFLLHGVTGSGKTEVYLHAIATCLELNRGALMLVPEIALTPQLVSRFRARFGDSLGVLHSGLSERDRYEMWKSLRDGQVHVAIGARSALFAPVPNLGLLIVDEEHDSSFKQEEGVRYNARDMSILRAKRAKAVCILGSATPSLESEALVRTSKITRLSLPERAHRKATLPKVELVDLRRTPPGPSGFPLLSLPLHRAIEQCLHAKEQVILFLNRRGFAPSVLCEGCGTIAQCPHCSVSLTQHRVSGTRLRCHYCEYDVPMWNECPECHAERFALVGLGTERLEQVLAESFPSARIARLDRDVAAGAKSEAILDRMRNHEADILVGTQMVTKGHDLPDVTLVGVINADAALSLPDFRAAERTFQLMVQVAGRAGRADRPGKVLVQTRLPDHPALRFALRHDVTGFIEHELENRKEAVYPPYAKIALVRLDSADEERVQKEAERIAAKARGAKVVKERLAEILGPSPAPLERLRGRYRLRILLRSEERGPLRALARTVDSILRAGIDNVVRASIDIDPIGML
jgi:primosomal protein N' (replication factor Y)